MKKFKCIFPNAPESVPRKRKTEDTGSEGSRSSKRSKAKTPAIIEEEEEDVSGELDKIDQSLGLVQTTMEQMQLEMANLDDRGAEMTRAQTVVGRRLTRVEREQEKLKEMLFAIMEHLQLPVTEMKQKWVAEDEETERKRKEKEKAKAGREGSASTSMDVD